MIMVAICTIHYKLHLSVLLGCPFLINCQTVRFSFQITLYSLVKYKESLILQNSHLGSYFGVPQQNSDAQFSAFSSCAFSAYMCCNCPLGTRNMNLNSSAIDELGKRCLKEAGGAMSQSSQMQRLSMTTLRMATTVTDRTDTCLIPTMQRGREQATSKLSKNYPVTKQMQNYLTSEAGPYNIHRLLSTTPGHTAGEATAGQHNFAFNFA